MDARIILRKASASLGLAIIMALAATAPASGQVQKLKGGITVTPAKVTLQLPTGNTPQEVAVGIRNNSSKAIRLNASIRGLQQNGGSLVPSPTADPGVVQALSVDVPDFVVEPEKSVNVKLKLRDAVELTPGGHYASLFIREVQEPGQSLTLSQAVSVQVFLVKEAGAVRAVTLENASDNGSLFRVPSSIIATFGNTGNVAVVPRASVGVYDARNRLVASGVLNAENVTVLPGQQTRLQTSLTGIGKAWIPGMYRLEVLYRYEGSDDQLTGSVTLLIAPPLFVAGLMLGTVTIAGLGWLGRRLWIRRRQRQKAPKKHVTVRPVQPQQPSAPGPAALGRSPAPTARSVPRRRPRRVIDI